MECFRNYRVVILYTSQSLMQNRIHRQRPRSAHALLEMFLPTATSLGTRKSELRLHMRVLTIRPKRWVFPVRRPCLRRCDIPATGTCLPQVHPLVPSCPLVHLAHPVLVANLIPLTLTNMQLRTLGHVQDRLRDPGRLQHQIPNDNWGSSD